MIGVIIIIFFFFLASGIVNFAFLILGVCPVIELGYLSICICLKVRRIYVWKEHKREEGFFMFQIFVCNKILCSFFCGGGIQLNDERVESKNGVLVFLLSYVGL